jgi:hypothetical protein
LLYFAWSPLVLIDVLGKAHNDILIALGALAALALAERPRSGALALPAVAASVLVKVSAAPVGLLLLVAQARRGAWRPLAVGLLVSTALSVALFALFWSGPTLLTSLHDQTSTMAWSPLTLVVLAAQAAFGGAASGPVRGICGAAGVAFTCVLLTKWSRWTTAGLATASAVLLLATYLLLTTDFYAHYLVPVIALAAISDSALLRRVVTALSLGSLGAYAVELGSLAFGSAWIGSLGYMLTGSLLEVVPPALVLGSFALSTWRRPSAPLGAAR